MKMDNTLKHTVAKAARELYAENISYDEFISIVPEQGEDELIDDLMYLIEHGPETDGFFGVSQKEHDEYAKEIFEIIEKLEHYDT